MKSKYLLEDLENLSSYIKENDFSKSTVMITGATGLIGSLCIKAIIEYNRKNADKINVVAFARNPEKVREVFEDDFDENGNINNVAFIYQDIIQKISIDVKCDYIIHTANSTASKFFITYPIEVIDSIFIGTKNILEYAYENDVKGVVYLSSMEVFGMVDTENRIKESDLGYIDIQNIRSCYSEGKRLAELMCKSYAVEKNVPVKTARLAQTFGAGITRTENRVFSQFARSAVNGNDIVLHTKGLSVGNYCYTSDVIRAIFLLLKKGENGDVYTVVNENTSITISNMAKMVAENFSNGSSKVIFDIPNDNSYGFAPDTKMRLSSQKLKKLGWSPTFDLLEMYKRMIPDLI